MKTYILPVKRWKHKLFHCPTFWEMLLGLKEKYNCPKCGKHYLCYWDGNDVDGHGTDYCDKCAEEFKE